MQAMEVASPEPGGPRYMFHCSECTAERRLERLCPLRPPEWAALERQGVRFEGSSAQQLVNSLEQQLAGGLSGELRSQVIAHLELLQARLRVERFKGRSFGEPDPDLCAWYALVAQENWIVRYLSNCRLDGQFRPILWRAGAWRDQPADWVDAITIIAGEKARLDRERLSRPTSTS